MSGRQRLTLGALIAAIIVVVSATVGIQIGRQGSSPSAGATPAALVTSPSPWAVTPRPTAAATAKPASTPPRPTPTVALTPTPEPTPAGGFSPISLKGRGSKVPRFTIPDGIPAIATFTHKGSANFVVYNIAADGSEIDLLVNEIGSYSGTVLIDAADGEHSVAFKIEADGAWTAKIRPLAAARRWDGVSTLTGKSDDVIVIIPETSGLTTVKASMKAHDNFVIYAFSAGDWDLLVNEIGSWSGEVLLPPSTYLLTVDGSGTWTVDPT